MLFGAAPRMVVIMWAVVSGVFMIGAGIVMQMRVSVFMRMGVGMFVRVLNAAVMLVFVSMGVFMLVSVKMLMFLAFCHGVLSFRLNESTFHCFITRCYESSPHIPGTAFHDR